MIPLYAALTNVQMLPLIGESLCAGQQTYGFDYKQGHACT
jgi:hypothetical protein